MQVTPTRQPFLLVLVFAVVCVTSALALVYTKHEIEKAVRRTRSAYSRT